MSNLYENVMQEFSKRNCKLLESKEKYYEIINNSKNYKLNYIASCGHSHIVFYNVFKYRNTGIICPSCKNKETGKNIKEKIKNNEMSKISNIEQEYNFIKEFQNLVKTEFKIIKAFDGCNIDIIYKPNDVIEDKWVGIQVKTTNKIHLTYSFHINNIYKNCLILFFCFQDKSMWLIPENIIDNQKKISIGYNNSKYNIYKINENIITDRLNELYNSSSKFEFDVLNTPINIYQNREQNFRKFRQEIINFIDFKYDEIEGTVYDFKINNFKIQEKVAKECNKLSNKYIFTLCKNNGKLNGKRNQIQYDINDNDFYWLNCENKKYFFVIPEKILIDKGFIGNKEDSKNKFIKITVTDELHNKTRWLKLFMFNYETINQEENKIRLLNLFT